MAGRALVLTETEPPAGKGYGSGSGSGHGHGHGHGYGFGYGYGSGFGYGYGSGSGSGYGSGSGHGHGYGHGYGSGYGYGSGSSYGDGSSYSSGSGSGYGYGSGAGYGSGSSSGSGYGSGSLFLAAWLNHPLVTAFTEAGETVTLGWWRSDETGQSANGGRRLNPAAAPGVLHSVTGPLQLCSPHALHISAAPDTWQGSRWWIAALLGEIQREDTKAGGLRRLIIADLGGQEDQ